VIGIIFGIGGTLLSIWEAVSTVFFNFLENMVPPDAGPNPFEAMSAWQPVLIALGIGSALIAILLLVGSIGLVMKKPWSRPTLIIWAIVKIVFSLGTAVQGYMIGSAIFKAMVESSQTPPPIFFSEGFLIASAVFNLLIYCGFPVFVLIWLNLKGPKRDVQMWQHGFKSPMPMHAPASPAPPPPVE